MLKKSILTFLFVPVFLIGQQAAAGPGTQCSSTGAAQLEDLRRLAGTDLVAAFDAVDKAIAKNPADMRLQKFRWYIALRTDRLSQVWTDQWREYERSRDKELGEFQLWCLFDNLHYCQASRFADEFVKNEHSSDRALYLRLWFSYFTGEYDKALADAKTLLGRKDTPEWRGWVALVRGCSGRTDTALKIFQRDEPTCGNSLSWMLSYATFLRNTGTDSDRRDKLLRQIIAVRSLSTVERFERFQRLLNGGFLEIPSARECIVSDWQQIAATDTVPEMDDNRILECLLVHARRKSDRREITKYINLLMKYRNWHTYLHVAAGFEDLGDMQKFVEYSRKCIASDPSLVHGYSTLSRFFESKKRMRESHDVFKNAGTVLKENHQLALVYAQFLFRQERYLETIAVCKEQLHQCHNLDKDFLFVYAEALHALKRYQEELTVLKAGLNVDSASDIWRNKVVRALQDWGRLKRAGPIIAQWSKDAQERCALELACVNALLDQKSYQAVIELTGSPSSGCRNDLDVLTRRASSLRMLSNFDEAINVYRQAQKLDPDNPIWLYRIIEVLESQGRISEACAAFARCDPHLENLDIACKYAEFLYRQEKFTEVLRVCRSQSKHHNPFIVHLEASTYHRLQNYDLAEKGLAELTKLEPSNVENWLTRVGLLLGTSQLAKARTVLDEAVQKHPQDVSLLLIRAGVSTPYSAGLPDPPDRLGDLNKVISLQPANQQARIARAQLLMITGEYAKASRDYSAIVSLPTRDFEALATALLKSDQLESGLQVTRKWLAASQHEEQAWFLHLCALHMLHRKSELECARIAAGKRGVHIAYESIVRGCFERFHYGSLSDYLSFLSDNDPKHEEEQMLRSLQKERDPSRRVDLLQKLGVWNSSVRRYKKAISYFNDALTLKPDSYALLLKRSGCYLALRQPQKSRQDRERALEVYARIRGVR